MILELKRRWFTAHSAIGELSVDGKFECFTLDCNYRERATTMARIVQNLFGFVRCKFVSEGRRAEAVDPQTGVVPTQAG